MGIDASKSADRNRSSIKLRRKEFRTLLCENLERRDLMAVDGPRLLSIAPNLGEIFSTTSANNLNESPRELVLRFDANLSAASVQNGSGIRISRSGGDGIFGNTGDVIVQPAFLNFSDPQNSRVVVARFAQPLLDDLYRVEVFGVDIPSQSVSALRDTVGVGQLLKPRRVGTDRDTYDFDLELGTKIIAVVPQPIVRDAGTGALTRRGDQIEVYFNDSELYNLPVTSIPGGLNPTVVDPSFYNLLFTKDTIGPADDVVFSPKPDGISYDPVLRKATLTFAQDIDQLTGVGGTFRLRVGTSLTATPITLVDLTATDPGGDLQSAANIGTPGSFSTVISQQIVTTTNPLLNDFPGSNFEPGHRDIQDESHLGLTTDSTQGITTVFYSFMDNQPYGSDSLGRPVFSSISPEQKQRVREIFEFYSAQLGIDVVEHLGPTVTGDGIKKVVVGDLNPLLGSSGPGGTIGIAPVGGELAIMDGAEAWDNTFGYGSNIPGTQGFFETTLHEIGHLLGLSHTYDLPPGTIQGSERILGRVGNPLEQIFPGDDDVIHGQRLYRPDNRDVDLYRFVLAEKGDFRAETIAERLNNSSNLDSYLTLLRRDGATGALTVVATNNNYFSDDSLISLSLEPGEYFISVTGKGNEDNNPETSNTGSGAVSQGRYDLRVDFKSSVVNGIVEEVAGSTRKGSALDGDGDGLAGGNFDFWFRSAALPSAVDPPVSAAAVLGSPTNPTTPRTLLVDRAFTGPGVANGSVAIPYNRISQATAVARRGDIIRVVGDSRTPTNLTDESAYEIGDGGGSVGILGDGASLDVPRGVTLMLEAGAILKLGGSRILVGSNDSTTDRSSSAVQVLGIPGLPVYFTSFSDESLGRDNNPLTTTPAAGNWGGIEIRNDFDRAQGRFDREREGIFLNTISNADMRFGGGQVGVGALAKVVSPIDLSEARPLILGNRISRSGDSAISADPNSFEETLFTEPRYQNGGAFVPDYSRVGPDFRSNTLTNNSINGLFVRIDTLAGQNLKTLSVPGRMNDSEMTIVLGENLIIEGTPGGSSRELIGPDTALVTTTILVPPDPRIVGPGFASAGPLTYILTYVDRFGQESLRSASILASVALNGAVLLGQLPTATLDYVSRKIWRQVGVGPFELAGVINRDDTSFVDNGLKLAGTLALPAASVQRARRDASLVVDPGSVVKSLGGRIEIGISATMLAEGSESKPIVFTSRLDDRFGAAGNFDTNNDGSAANPIAGNWAGIVSRHLGELSIDNALITFGGGNSRVPGGFASFNAIEVHQSTARIANSVIEKNASGAGTAGTTNRDARGKNDEAAIFVLASQPIILNNIIRNNFTNAADRDTAAISIDANSLNSDRVFDVGRSTGTNQRENVGIGNFGPLVNNNQLGRNALNGMIVRGATLTTESVWDDTDIVHILQSEIVVPDFHSYGGLRLTSKADESLVVKLSGANAGFTASGRPLDIKDRIGGSLQLIGAQGFPVVLTSLSDDTIGAGFDFAGGSLLDTNNNGATVGSSGDWRSVRFEPFSNDRNVDFNYEREADQIAEKGTNDFPTEAQDLGLLASNLSSSDENLRLGTILTGSIASPGDLDVYRFVGTAGSTLWIDLDQTTATLDSVVELIDGNGQIIALSNNSIDESVAGSVYFNPAFIPTGRVWPMDQQTFAKTNTFQPLAHVDFLGVNPLDAGFRVVLPGSAGSQNNYFVRVRSSNVSPVDLLGVARSSTARLTDPALVRSGITVGEYKMHLRLQQTQEVAGSTVRFADIRFATTGIEALGQPLHSPLLGEVGELNPNEANAASGSTINIGNILSNDRGASSIAGNLAANGDIDWYDFTIVRDSIQSVSPTAGHHSVTFDIDYADGLGRANTQLWIFQGDILVATADNSNIQDDQPAPLRGSDVTDLTRGSAGNRDAYIGPIELPAGNYRVAVSNGSLSHIASQQFSTSTTTQNLVRFEPLDSVRRISEDRIDGGGSRPTTNQAAVIVAFGNEAKVKTSSEPNFGNTGLPSAVPFNLSDVTFFVATNAGGASRMQYANALTGAKEAEASNDGSNPINLSTSNGINDIAVSPAGAAFGAVPPNGGRVDDANAGTFIGINIGDAGVAIPAAVGSGLQTFANYFDAATPPNIVARRSQDAAGAAIGDGMVFNALTFSDFRPNGGNAATFWGVANRHNDGASSNEIPPITINPTLITKNIVYRLDPATGAALSWDTTIADRTGNGLSARAGTQKVELGQFSTAVGTVTGLATINQVFFGVTNQGELVTMTGGRTVINDPTTLLPIVFTGMSAGPRNVEGGRYANMLFGITAGGRIYAFSTAGVLQPIFQRGATVIQGTDLGTVGGIDFSSLDVNLWHESDQESGVAGHGRPADFNNSRDAVGGGNSLKFGFTNPSNARRQVGTWNGIYDIAGFYDNSALPGGAMGALESDLIDLRDYSANDQPMLYFNYSTANQNPAANSNDGSALGDGRAALDAFRVYGIGDRGEWILLGTNNSTRDNNFAGGTEEYDVPLNRNRDIFGRSYASSELFDGQGWRQARINLAPLAGQRDIRIRFEFSTGGDFRTNDPLRGGVELVAVSGDRIKDGDFVTVSGTRFEFDLGLVLNTPSGASIVSGTDGIRLNGVDHFFGTNIPFLATDTPTQLAAKVRTYLQSQGFGVATHSTTANVLNVSGVSTASIIGADPAIIIGSPGVSSGLSVNITNAMTATQVRDAIRNSLMIAFNAVGQRGPTFGEPSNLNRVRGNSIILFNETIGAKQGPVGGTTNRIGDKFGPLDNATATAFGTASYLRAGLRTQTNLATLVRIDDIVIGFAERGEMINTAPAGVDNFAATFQYEVVGGLNGTSSNQIETGTYQLEIRTAADYGTTNGNELRLETTFAGPLGRTIDTNDRLTNSYALVFNSASGIADGATFTLSDGFNTSTFEFDVTTSAADRRVGVTAGSQRIAIAPNATAVEIARAVRDAINDSTTQANIKITAITSGDMQGVIGSVLTDLPFATGLAAPARSVRVQLNGQVSSNTLGGIAGFTGGGVPITLVTYGQDTKWGEDLGDGNVTRDQGQFIVSSSSISDSSGFGLNIDAAAQAQSGVSNFAGNRPYPGAVRNLVTLNSSNVAPGAVVINNVIARNASGGIRISGDTVNTNGNPPLTVARVLNNTLFGRGTTDTGILVNEGASPTVLNNIVSRFQIGISVAGTGTTVLGANIYQSNGANTAPANLAQSFEIDLAAGDPLFINSAIGRFYLASLSQAIDSSIASLENRSSIEQVKDGIGLPVSPIIAPSFDVNGLRRGDDPLVNTPAGQGQNVFIDRGAIDRVDFLGPIAVIQRPLDNDSQNIDRDLSNTYLRLRTGNYDFFEVLLDERTGTGTDPLTITANSLILTENGRRLIDGSDYIFGFSANSRTIRLTPLAGFWRNDSIYEMTLVNKQTARIDALSGDKITDGTKINLTTATGIPFVLEFDNNNSVAVGSIRIPYTATAAFTSDLVAQQIVKAINSIGLGVKATPLGFGLLIVEGIQTLTGTGTVLIPAISDLASNQLQTNRANSLTQFTILMPEVGVDYGDARPGANNRTLQANDGVRHGLYPDDIPLLVLGQFAGANVDGQPSVAADADDFGSAFTFSAGLPMSIGSRGPTRLNFVAAPTAAVLGKKITISDTINRSVTYQFIDSINTPPLVVGNVAVDLTGVTTAAGAASSLTTAIRNSIRAGRITGIHSILDGSSVAIGGTSGHIVDLSDLSGVTFVKKQASGSVDFVVPAVLTGLVQGQTFTIQDGSGNTVTFQIINTTAPVALISDNDPIVIDTAAATQSTFTTAVGNAINGAITAGRLKLPTVVFNATTGILTVNADDEDGVRFNGLFNASVTPPVSVVVTASGSGYLDAWFDWNQDSDFDDAGEQTLVSQPVVAGGNTFLVSTPVSAVIGYTTARFRLSATGGLFTYGLVVGGEVEDHIIEVLAGVPPVAVNDPDPTKLAQYRVNEDLVLTVSTADGVLFNDTDVDTPAVDRKVFDEDPFLAGIQPVTTTQNGTVVLSLDGSFVYTPNANFFGTDTFSYRLTDPRLVSNNIANVTITVNPVNDVPFANPDTITLSEDNVQTWAGALFTGNDIQGITLPLPGVAIANEANTTVGFPAQKLIVKSVNLVTAGRPGESVSVTNNVISYTPGTNYNERINGPVLIRLEVEDDGVTGFPAVADFKSAFSTLTVNITAVNDSPLFNLAEVVPTVAPNAFTNAPTVNANSEEITVTANEDAPTQKLLIFKNIVAGPVLAEDELFGNAFPADKQPTDFIVTIRPQDTYLFTAAGLPKVNQIGGGIGELEFTLAPDANTLALGPAIVTFQIDDKGGPGATPNGPTGPLSKIHTVTINVRPVNDAPILVDDTKTFDEDFVQSWNQTDFTGNDLPGPANENLQTLTIVNAQLVDPLNPSNVIPPRSGESIAVTTVGPNTFVNYTPGTNYNLRIGGTVFVRLSIKDSLVPDDQGSVQTLTSILRITINPVNDSPLFNLASVAPTVAPNAFTNTPTVSANGEEITVTVNEDAPTQKMRIFTGIAAGPVLAEDELFGNAFPADKQPTDFIVTIRPQDTYLFTATGLPKVNLIGGGIGELEYTLAADANSLALGPAIVTFQIDDKSGAASTPNGPTGNLSKIHTVTINVRPVNDAPILLDDAKTFDEDIAQSWNQTDFLVRDVTGPANENLQTLKIVNAVLVNSANVVIAARPGESVSVTSVGPNTFVNYTPGTNYNRLIASTVFVRLSIQDSLDINDQGTVQTVSSLLAITIDPVNDSPLFDLVAVPPTTTVPTTNPTTGSMSLALTLEEDVATQKLAIFSGIAAGPALAFDELGNVVDLPAQPTNFIITVRPQDRFLFTAAGLPKVNFLAGGTGELEFTLAPDANTILGPVVITFQINDNGGAGTTPNGPTGPLSKIHTVTINVNPVNDAPQFTMSTNTFNTVEDTPLTRIPGFLTGIVPGPATAIDEFGQTVTIRVAPADAINGVSYFKVQPRITGTGDLEFQLNDNVNSRFSGSLNIAVTATDNGTPLIASTTKILTITAADINDSPSFTLNKPVVSVREDEETFAPATTRTEILDFVGNLKKGPDTALDERGLGRDPAQTLSFETVVNSNPSLFTATGQPFIDPSTGSLIFHTSPDRSGSSVFVVRLVDNGRVGPPPNSNVGSTATFTINISSVNDAPEFSLPPSLQTTVNEDQGVVTVPGFATGVRPGPATAIDESTQELTFIVRAENPLVFAVQPTLQADGTLVFQTARDVNNNTRDSSGVLLSRRVFVSLRDNGSSVSPNVNQSAEQMFTVNITPVNDPPIPSVHIRQGVEDTRISFNTSSIFSPIPPEFADSPGPLDELAAGQVVRMTQIERTTDLGGVLTPVFVGDQIVSFQYTPPINYVGDDIIRYVVTDDGVPQQSATGTITIQLAPVNDPPQFVPGLDITVQEDAPAFSAPWAASILAGPPSAVDEINGVPPLIPAQTVTFAITTNNDALFAGAAGFPKINGAGVLTFTLAKDANGRAILDVAAVDSGSGVSPSNNRSAIVKLTIVASPVNDAPGFNVIGNVSVDEDSSRYSGPAIKNIVPAQGMNDTPATGSDELGQVITILTTNNNTGLFSVQPTISASGILEFVPAQDAFGSAIVSVIARDNGANTPPNVNESAPKTFTITLRPINDAPVAVNDRYSTGEDVLLTINAPGVISNDRDVDLPNDTITVATSQSTSTLGAIVSVLPNGQFTYDSRNAAQLQRLVNGETALDTFTYTLRDAVGATSNLATVTITVSGNNDAPIAVDDNLSVPFGVTELLNVLANDRDADTSIDPRTVEIGQLASHGTVTAQPTGRIQYRPVPGFKGVDTFTYRVRDALGALSNEALVTVTINSAPSAVADFVRTNVNTPVVVDVLQNDSDSDGTLNRNSVAIASGPDVGSAVVQADGTIRYSPSSNFVGTATLQYSVLDNDGLASNIATVTIVVGGSIHQNPANRLDVNGDGSISPIDVLNLVNDINFNGIRTLPSDLPVPPYLDPNGNGQIDPLDVLDVINYINAQGNAGAGEGESSMADLGYSQAIVRIQSKDEILSSILRSEYHSSTEGQIDLAVLAVSTESSHYGPALATASKDDGSDESLESYLAGWVTKPKRSESSLDSIFADETWM